MSNYSARSWRGWASYSASPNLCSKPYSSHDLTAPSNCNSHPNPPHICGGSTLFTTQQKTLSKTAYHIKYTKMAYTNTPVPKHARYGTDIRLHRHKRKEILCVYQDMTSSHMLTATRNWEGKLTHVMNVGFLMRVGNTEKDSLARIVM